MATKIQNNANASRRYFLAALTLPRNTAQCEHPPFFPREQTSSCMHVRSHLSVARPDHQRRCLGDSAVLDTPCMSHTTETGMCEMDSEACDQLVVQTPDTDRSLVQTAKRRRRPAHLYCKWAVRIESTDDTPRGRFRGSGRSVKRTVRGRTRPSKIRAPLDQGRRRVAVLWEYSGGR